MGPNARQEQQLVGTMRSERERAPSEEDSINEAWMGGLRIRRRQSESV